ncbi:MAG: hypothetical protein ACJA2J_001355 [Candidatus Azotimanducaceae bacterium]
MHANFFRAHNDSNDCKITISSETVLRQTGLNRMSTEPRPTQRYTTPNGLAWLVLGTMTVPQDLLATSLVRRDVGSLQVKGGSLACTPQIHARLTTATGNKLDLPWMPKFSIKFRHIRRNIGFRHRQLPAKQSSIMPSTDLLRKPMTKPEDRVNRQLSKLDKGLFSVGAMPNSANV